MKFRKIKNKLSESIRDLYIVFRSNKNSEEDSFENKIIDFNSKKLESEQFFIKGKGELEECLACFNMTLNLLDLPFRKDHIKRYLKEELNKNSSISLRQIAKVAANQGLHASGTKIKPTSATRLKIPLIIMWKKRPVVAIESNQNYLTIASPKEGIIKINSTELEINFPNGIEVLMLEGNSLTKNNKFGIKWFIPSLKRHKRVFSQVIFASFIIQIFTLANPLIIQVIIDKVINQRSLDTLQILGIALVAVSIFEGFLNGLKSLILTQTTNRIDQRLGSELIDHLLRVPLQYFEKRPVGELSSRINELQKIRNFFTNQGLTSILDACFSLIYILVMIMYSWSLTLVALAVLPLQIVLTLVSSPIYRQQLKQEAESNAKTQSHLVEVLTNIQSVKSQSAEIISRWKWQKRYNDLINKSFNKTISSITFTQISQVLQKISQLIILWYGSYLVLSGRITLGQLIAFRIISGYVTQPLLRLSTIWQNIQSLKVSLERLGDLVDTPQESSKEDKSKIPMPKINGDVSFKNIGFYFNKFKTPVLRNINFEIKAGSFIGIIGESGSGKSTLIKLLSRLYPPSKGSIYIDNLDIDKVELYSLRTQIGIVPQEPLLFAGSVKENISLSVPDADINDIISASKIAEAHDFIMRMPNGYNSEIGERGANLSGGQRQRIAIARTILSNPNLIILDEATSALDFETEKKVVNNLINFFNGKTTFFITHRLFSIRNADVIFVMDKGEIVESGSHQDLINLGKKYYQISR